MKKHPAYTSFYEYPVYWMPGRGCEPLEGKLEIKRGLSLRDGVVNVYPNLLYGELKDGSVFMLKIQTYRDEEQWTGFSYDGIYVIKPSWKTLFAVLRNPEMKSLIDGLETSDEMKVFLQSVFERNGKQGFERIFTKVLFPS